LLFDFNTMLPNSLTTYLNLDYFANETTPDAKVDDDIANRTPFASITVPELNASPLTTVIKSINFEAIDATTGGAGSNNLVVFYTTNYRYPLTASVQVRFRVTPVGAAFIYISPICIKYRW